MLFPLNNNVKLSHITIDDPLLGIIITVSNNTSKVDVLFDEILSQEKISDISVEQQNLLLKLSDNKYNISLEPMTSKLIGVKDLDLKFSNAILIE